MKTVDKLSPGDAIALFTPLVAGGLPALVEHVCKEHCGGPKGGDGAATFLSAAQAGEPPGARIDPAGWYSIAEVSRLLPWTARTLEAWRGAGKGPAWSRVGGRILYRGDDLLRFLEAGRRLDAEERRALRAGR